jgi:SAM-dependent methyltransferase
MLLSSKQLSGKVDKWVKVVSMTPPTEYVCCNLCGGRTVTVQYASVLRIDTPATQVVKCDNCGLVFLNPRLQYLADSFTLNEAYLNQFYLPLYQAIGLLTATQTLDPEKNLQFHQGALEQMRSYRVTNRVLDVGCAIGLFLAAAQADNWEAFGVEPSSPLGNYGREKFGLSIAQGELSEMDFPAHYFDVVALWDVTEHLLNPKATYQLISRVLRPGGLLLLRMPNWQSIARELLGPEWEMFVTDHFYYFTPVTLGKLLRQTGFVPRYIEARNLVDVEIETIKTKLGSQGVEDAMLRLSSNPNCDCGSTITAAAEKSLSPSERLRRAGRLVRVGAFGTLAQEMRNYGTWKLAERQEQRRRSNR